VAVVEDSRPLLLVEAQCGIVAFPDFEQDRAGVVARIGIFDMKREDAG